MSIRRSIVTAVAVALAATGALTGCNDDEPEAYDPGLPSESELTASTEPTPEPSDPTPTEPRATGPQAPPIPEAAKASGKQGAKAFVAYYIKLLNYASHTGEGSTLLRYGPTCRVCKSQASFAAKTYRRGGWFKGGDWLPDPRTWFVVPSGPGFFVAVNVDTAPGRQLPRRGGDITRFEAGRLRINLLLKRTTSAWQVRNLGTPS